MNRVLFLVVLVALLVSVPIAIKYAIDARHLQHDLTAQMEAASVMRAQLTQASDSLKSTTDHIVVLTNNLDSLSRLYAQASTLAGQLSNKVARVSRVADSLKALSQERLAQFQEQGNALSSIRVRLADTAIALTDARRRLDSTSTLLQERTVLISQLQPWYIKWKHDATERNWLEKLFGADKAKSPDFQEPASLIFPTDSVRSDTPVAKPAVG